MKLIVISNPVNINNEHALLNSMFEAGLEYFHLRKPNFTLNETEEYLKQIPTAHLNKIVLHSHHELVEKYKLKGKHKTSTTVDLSVDTQYISTSFHSLEELSNCRQKYEYVFLSPVFDSISKPGYKSNFDKTKLKNFFSQKNENNSLSSRSFGTSCGESYGEVIALGGIEQHNIQIALESGFSGVAVLGSIWLSENPVTAFLKLNATCKQYQAQDV